MQSELQIWKMYRRFFPLFRMQNLPLHQRLRLPPLLLPLPLLLPPHPQRNAHER